MGCCSSDPDKSRDKSKNKRKQYSENVHPNKNEQVVPVQPNKKNKATKQDEKLLNLYNIISQNNNFTLLLDQQVFIQLFHQIRGTQLPKLSANALISLLQNYIRYSIKLITFNSLKVQVPFTYNLSDYGHIFGRQIREIRDNINTQNNCQVRTLRYFDQFKKYKFRLGEQNKGEIDKLQNKVKELSQHDPLAVFYMVSYIKIACKQMEENGQSMQSINKKLKKKVDEINQSFSPNADFKQDLLYIEALQKKELDRLKNEEHDYKKITFNLLERDKKKEINKRIVQIADKSKTQQRSLHDLTYGCCMENEGFGYSLGSKIRDIEDENAIKRVKQKLFKDEIEKQYKNKQFKSKSIKDLRKEQFKFKKNVMKDIYENLGKVQFNVTDLLRGRCFFKKFSQINNSALAIIQKIKEAKRMGHKMQLIQVDNRLKDATKDLVLKIKINQTVTQFQLGLRFRQTQSEIYHKMYEISRSEMLSPLVYLYEVERHLTNQYFSLLDEVVKEINQPREVKSDIKKKAEELKKFIKFKQDHQDDSSQDEAGQSPHYPYEGLYKQQNLIPQRIEELKKQRSMRTGDYALELGTYQEACRLYKNQIEEVTPSERLTKQKAIKKISEMLALNRIKPSKSLEQINLKLQ